MVLWKHVVEGKHSENHFSNSLLIFGRSCSVMLSCNNDMVLQCSLTSSSTCTDSVYGSTWFALAQTVPEHRTFSKTILTSMVSTHMNLNALVTG